jgi:tetratricopeptide (TPR) repeat protein
MLALRLPSVVGDISFDQAAIRATGSCTGSGAGATNWRAESTRYYSPSEASWLKLMEVRCTGSDQEARGVMREVLAASDARLGAIRSMAQYDTDLAGFAAATYPNRAEAHFWLGDASAKQGDSAGAIQAYERGLALQNTDGNIWMALGTAYEARGDLQAAVGAYDQACRWVDTGSNGCSSSGEIYQQMGLYELAAERYQASIKQIGYTWLPSEQGLVTALIALGRINEAIPHLTILAANGSIEAQETLRQLQGPPK